MVITFNSNGSVTALRGEALYRGSSGVNNIIVNWENTPPLAKDGVSLIVEVDILRSDGQATGYLPMDYKRNSEGRDEYVYRLEQWDLACEGKLKVYVRWYYTLAEVRGTAEVLGYVTNGRISNLAYEGGSSTLYQVLSQSVARMQVDIDDFISMTATAETIPHGQGASVEIVKTELPDGRANYAQNFKIPEGSPGITLPGTGNPTGRTTLPIMPGMWEGTEAPFSVTLPQEQHKMGNNALTVSAQIDRGGGLLDVMPLTAVRNANDYSVTVYSNERFGGMLMFDGGVAEDGAKGEKGDTACIEWGTNAPVSVSNVEWKTN